MSRTPLQVLAEVLGAQPEANAAALKVQLHRLARSRRAREVTEYLIAAAEGRLPRRRKGGGSLKHILWWLRDHGGELYEPAARAVLREALAGAWPLGNALPHVADEPLLQPFLQDLQRPVDWRALARDVLRSEQVAEWRVAVNTTPLNLTGPAMRLGYDVMVARSEAGAAVKARRGLKILAALLPGDAWAQPYPDLVVWQTEAGTPPPVDALVQALHEAVKRSSPSGG